MAGMSPVFRSPMYPVVSNSHSSLGFVVIAPHRRFRGRKVEILTSLGRLASLLNLTLMRVGSTF
jgi:hypothetical protein